MAPGFNEWNESSCGTQDHCTYLNIDEEVRLVTTRNMHTIAPVISGLSGTYVHIFVSMGVAFSPDEFPEKY